MWVFAQLVYLLCLFTSLVCTALLFRGWRRNGRLLLLCSAVCFVFLSLNNVLLFVDVVMLPNTDLRVFRGLVNLLGVTAMLYGFIWEPD